MDHFKTFLTNQVGHPLKGWLQFFDQNGDSSVTKEEFQEALEKLDYPGNAMDLFLELDEDESGFLTINEIDPWSAQVWCAFKRWCVNTFNSKEDLVAKMRSFSREKLASEKRASLGGELDGHVPSMPSMASRRESMAFRRESRENRRSLLGLPVKEDDGAGFTEQQFLDNAARLGWYGGMESLLFQSMDLRETGLVTKEEVSTWFDSELRSHGKRQSMRLKRQKNMAHRTRSVAQHSLHAFKKFLQGRYSYLFHAWRSKLDRDGSMTVTRKEVFKATSDMGWHGDTAALWHSLDSDDSGICSLDEFCLAEARVLAVFKRIAQDRWGSVLKHFRAMQRAAKIQAPGGRLDKDTWIYACQKLGITYDANLVFDLLDWEKEGSLCVRDLRCLDIWQPPAWLADDPDPVAAEAFKKELMKKYHGSAVRAWRMALDRDNTGRATFKEFKMAAERIGFMGNLAGAYLGLDVTNDGCISLAEIDEQAARELRRFRHWAHQVFGCVSLAFDALDTDHSDALSWKEFRKAVKEHHYKGDIKHLFDQLDTDMGGQISRAECIFLDDWCEALAVHVDEENLLTPIERRNSLAGAFKLPMFERAPLEASPSTAAPTSAASPLTAFSPDTEGSPLPASQPWRKVPNMDSLHSTPFHRQRRGLPRAWVRSPGQAEKVTRQAPLTVPLEGKEDSGAKKLDVAQLLTLINWIGDGKIGSREWAVAEAAAASKVPATVGDLLGPRPTAPEPKAVDEAPVLARRHSGSWGGPFRASTGEAATLVTATAESPRRRPQDGSAPGLAYPLSGWTVYGFEVAPGADAACSPPTTVRGHTAAPRAASPRAATRGSYSFRPSKAEVAPPQSARCAPIRTSAAPTAGRARTARGQRSYIGGGPYRAPVVPAA